MEMTASRRQFSAMQREKDEANEARDKMFEQVRHCVVEAARIIETHDKEAHASVVKRRRAEPTLDFQ